MLEIIINMNMFIIEFYLFELLVCLLNLNLFLQKAKKCSFQWKNIEIIKHGVL